MTEWEVITMLITLISFITIFVGMAWKFGRMIAKLETLIESLSKTINRIETEQKEDKEQILQKIEDHDLRLRRVEVKLGEIHD